MSLNDKWDTDVTSTQPSTHVEVTVGSKTVAMFGHFGLIVMQCLTAWKLHLALVGWS